MKMRIFCFLMTGVLMSVSPVEAQQHLPTEELRFAVDYARFRGDDRNLYVEVYYSFPEGSLTYESGESGWKGGADLTLAVFRNDSVTYADRWIVPHTVPDASALKGGMNLIGVAALMLPAGEYRLMLLGRDMHDAAKEDSVSMPLRIQPLPSGQLALSDLELASSITQGEKGSPFYKNTLMVIPNATGLFREDQSCFYYAEAYNILATGEQSDYMVKTVVTDAIGRDVISRERPRKRVGESSVLVDQIAVGNLRTGTYTLVVALLDGKKNVISSSGKKFFVLNTVLGVDTTLARPVGGISAQEFAGMDEPALDQEFTWTKYEASETEKDQFRKLQGVESKRTFLTQFWNRRPFGHRTEYLRRVAHANGAFTVLGREGYMTDRGRVYITYGPPDDLERYPNDPESKPYEIWNYNALQGGVHFVFVQRQIGGGYDLVHSTHRNELQDENWRRIALLR